MVKSQENDVIYDEKDRSLTIKAERQIKDIGENVLHIIKVKNIKSIEIEKDPERWEYAGFNYYRDQELIDIFTSINLSKSTISIWTVFAGDIGSSFHIDIISCPLYYIEEDFYKGRQITKMELFNDKSDYLFIEGDIRRKELDILIKLINGKIMDLNSISYYKEKGEIVFNSIEEDFNKERYQTIIRKINGISIKNKFVKRRLLKINYKINPDRIIIYPFSIFLRRYFQMIIDIEEADIEVIKFSVNNENNSFLLKKFEIEK